MEAKGRKMVAMGVVIALCAVAMIGAAYAAFAGNASTYNQGNTVTPGFMTLTPDGDTAAARWAAISSTGSQELDTYSYVIIGIFDVIYISCVCE